MKVSLDNLDEEIKKALEDYKVEVVRATNESIKEAAKEAVKTLKNGGLYQNKISNKSARLYSLQQRPFSINPPFGVRTPKQKRRKNESI